jgi:hypothetical protein
MHIAENAKQILYYITEEDVKDILQTLKISYACGDDGINHQILKSTSEFICIHLTIIFRHKLLSFYINHMVSFIEQTYSR